MAGEHIGHAAHLAPAHRIGLTGDAERLHAGAADAVGGKMAIQDGMHLVGAGGRLVDALGIDGDDLFGPDPQGTIPLDSGPPLWGQRSVMAKT